MELQFFAEIQKVDESQRMVYGYASTTSLDSQGDIITKEALIEALPEYLKFSNVREMHQPSAVGITKSVDVDDKGWYIGAKIVDESAWIKVKEGVYKGFSIGGKSLVKVDNTINKLRISEISLVDRPANPECVIELYKAEGIEVENAQEKKEDVPVQTNESIPAADVKEETEEKAQEVQDVQKGMYDVAQLACLIDQINCLKTSAEFEAMAEGDNSTLPAKLKKAVITLSAILKDMVVEESKELTQDDVTTNESNEVISYSEKSEDIEKAGARNSRSDNERLQKMHDLSMELGASCGGADSAKTESAADISKMEDLQKSISKLEQEKEDLQKKVAELEALPKPAKGALKVIEKGHDINFSNPKESEEDEKNKDNPLYLLKRAHENPVPFEKFISK